MENQPASKISIVLIKATVLGVNEKVRMTLRSVLGHNHHQGLQRRRSQLERISGRISENALQFFCKRTGIVFGPQAAQEGNFAAQAALENMPSTTFEDNLQRMTNFARHMHNFRR